MCEDEAWDDEEEMAVRLFREGDLVYVGQDQLSTNSSIAEIALAEHNGELVGANGIATLYANCSVCGWKGHTHFIIGDEERDMAYDTLEQKHIEPSSCHGELEFRERSQ